MEKMRSVVAQRPLDSFTPIMKKSSKSCHVTVIRQQVVQPISGILRLGRFPFFRIELKALFEKVLHRTVNVIQHAG